jgi:hypothetical protein
MKKDSPMKTKENEGSSSRAIFMTPAHNAHNPIFETFDKAAA